MADPILSRMKPFYLLPLLVIGLSGCDSQSENQREAALEKKADAAEEQADATRDVAEKKADAIESTKTGSQTLNPATPQDKAAGAVRKEGEAQADALENKADAVRDAK